MDKLPRLAVIGDINVELSFDISERTFQEITHDILLYRPITLRIGGTASNFANASLNYFDAVHVIGKVGDDLLGHHAITHLRALGISVHCGIEPQAPTGLGIQIRDAYPVTPQGVRLLTIRANSANRELTVDDIMTHADIVATSNLLMLDGYCFLDSPRREASLTAVSIAQAHKVPIALDLVPHNAYVLYDLGALKTLLAPVDILITELATIRHFLGLNVSASILDKTSALDTVPVLQSELGNKIVLLRFGVGNLDQSMICVPHCEPQHSFTGYSGIHDTHCFGDELSARELFSVLTSTI
jgi:sugar/nucleoside kinase (ribokinase family)